MARPRSFDEQRVLQAVRDRFWDAGYAATSLDDLMQVSGLGKGSLYAAFGDKHQLFLRALRSYADNTASELREVIAAAPRALDGLRMVVMAPVSDSTGAAARRGCLMANSTCELASDDPDVREQARHTFETMTALIADGVARAQREGDVPTHADPTALAWAVLAALEGLTFLGRTGMDIDTLAAIARSLADHLLPDQRTKSAQPRRRPRPVS